MSSIYDHVLDNTVKAAYLGRLRRVAALINKGVTVPCPESIELGDDVLLERIAPGVTLHAGTRLRGARTLLAPGASIGREGSATVEDCVVGHDVSLDGGYFSGATFLDGSGARSYAHIRTGCLFEEYASVAHCVGLKQTLLFPWVTLGSLINFCDVLMAGGTGSKDHSEVGSGYIHFNFTPRGDKATPSLFGDVPRGIRLDQKRIFLGGLGATVGPIQVGYGAFLGPGEIFRRDVEENRFQLGQRRPRINMEYESRILTGVTPKMKKNVAFLGQLHALEAWYTHARPLLTGGDPWRAQTFEAGRETIAMAITERRKQIRRLMALLPESIECLENDGPNRNATAQRALLQTAPDIEAALDQGRGADGDLGARDQLLNALQAAPPGQTYVDAIQGLSPDAADAITQWLTSVIDASTEQAASVLSPLTG